MLVVDRRLPRPSSPTRAPATDGRPDAGVGPRGRRGAPLALLRGFASEHHGDPSLRPERAHRGTLHHQGQFPRLGVSGEPSPGQARFSISRMTVCMSEFLCEDFGVLDSFLDRTHL